MGAHDFQTEAFGATAGDAFTAAVKQAHWEHGHDPYNGTISTVDWFVEVAKPARLTDEEFVEFVWWLERDAYERGPRPSWHKWTHADLPYLPVQRKFNTEWQRTYYKRQRALLTKACNLTVEELAACFTASQSIRKWESCVAFRVSKKAEAEWRRVYGYKGKRGHVWSFFGLAAS